MLETAWKTTLTLKLRVRPLIIEAPNFQRKSRTPKNQQYIKSLLISSKIIPENFSSQKLSSQELVLKVPKKKPSAEPKRT